ncbi:MAG: hypothetical protein Q618_VCMC00001G1361 [Varibaculum cambriense DORA_20]|nr:MAG: hypothetical protein Q618_VCMC00001G1361 [Varibaculum cambriense DORA_20]
MSIMTAPSPSDSWGCFLRSFPKTILPVSLVASQDVPENSRISGSDSASK